MGISSELYQIISTLVEALAFIIQLLIGTLTYFKIRRSEVAKQLKIVFLFSFLSALSCNLSIWAAHAFRLLSYDLYFELAVSIAQFFGGCFWCSLLCTLVTRLHLTFKGSALELSKSAISIFVCIFALLFLAIMLGWVAGILNLNANDDDEDLEQILYLYALCSFLLLYVAGSALSVHLFMTKLSAIAKGISSENDQSSKGQEVKLNRKQQKLLNLSAKYILLFFVAISTSILAFLLWITVLLADDLAALFIFADFCVNLVCIRFQFAFATSEYQKCCGFLDACCRTVVLNRGKKQFHKELTVEMYHVSERSIETSGRSIDDTDTSVVTAGSGGVDE